jgi:hypothetical protein
MAEIADHLPSKHEPLSTEYMRLQVLKNLSIDRDIDSIEMNNTILL